MINQEEIHMIVQNKAEERREVVFQLHFNFANLPDKNLAWSDLIKLVQDEDSDVRWHAADALSSIFSYVPDKKQAWKDLHGLTKNVNNIIRWHAAETIGSAFPYINDKKQAWSDLHRLAQDEDSIIRWHAAEAIGSAFPYIHDKKQALSDLHGLAQDKDIVRIFAYHSLGRAYIYKATDSNNEKDFRKELEQAIIFFEKSEPESTYKNFYGNPAVFCLPFYRSFYALTFKKEEAEAEVQKYLLEAKSAVAGSKSKETLLEAVENLGNALKEAQNARNFNELKDDLNAYRKYCDRACELLDTTEEKAPGASRLIRKGLPIIDERIKGIIAEIHEKAKALCKQVKDTEYKEIGQQVNNVGQELSKVIDPIRLEKEVSHMLIPLSAMCKKMPEEDRGEACEILKQINDEQNVEDKLPLISMFLSKISTQMSKEPIIGNIHIENSEGVQVIVGTGNKQIQDSNSFPK